MPKIREKQTIVNLIFSYKFNHLSSTGDLDAWFADFLSSAEQFVQFDTVRLSNLHTSNSEEGGPKELDVREVRKGILQPMRDAHANRLVVHFTYQDADMTLSLTLGEWVVSLVCRRKDAAKLRELAALLNFDR